MTTTEVRPRWLSAIRKPEAMQDKNLVEAALAFAAEEGIDAKTFCETVIPAGCDEKTIYRWRKGYSALVTRRRAWFEKYVRDHLPKEEEETA
jgi:hypothetical protein